MMNLLKTHNATPTDIYARSNVQCIDTLPRRIQIVSTMRCNYRCIQCFQPHESHAGGGELDFALIEKLAPILPFVREVYFTGGEPLLYSRFAEALELIARAGCELSMSTNGALLDGERLEMCLKHMHMLKISVDAATPETYAKIRRGGSLEKVLENFARVAEHKRCHNTPFPQMRFGFVAMRSNIEELSKLVVLARKYGVEHIRVAHAHLTDHTSHLEDERLAHHQELSDHEMLKAAAVAEELGVKLAMPSLFGADEDARLKRNTAATCYDDGFCNEPWTYFLLNPDGSTGLCCPRSIGKDSLVDKSFHEVWNSRQAQAIRRQLNTANEPAVCAGCYTHKRRKPRTAETCETAQEA
mgnify:CR=1 FL=1